MAVRSKEEILEQIRKHVGDDTSDDAISLVEDVNDTINAMETDENNDWKQKYEENDATWRQKYRDRFFGAGADDEPPIGEEDGDGDADDKPLTYENLFKEE